MVQLSVWYQSSRLFILIPNCIYRGHEAVGKPTGRAIQHRIGGGSNRCQNIRCHHDPPRKQPEGERTGKYKTKTTLYLGAQFCSRIKLILT